jgi:hypothetical protein
VASHASIDDRVLVAAPRPPRRRPAASRHVVDASGAGLTFIVVVCLIAALGAWVGGRFGLALSGAIIGATLGLPIAFSAIYLRYKSL